MPGRFFRSSEKPNQGRRFERTNNAAALRRWYCGSSRDSFSLALRGQDRGGSTMFLRRIQLWGLVAVAVAALGAGPTLAQVLPRRSRAPIVEPAQPSVLRVRVLVPADADLSINGMRTSQKGSVRGFVSPVLEAGQKYAYEFRARWKSGGKDVERTQRITFKAGDRLTVDFTKGTVGPVGPAPMKTLYDRLGGAVGIKVVVDDVVARASADSRVNFTRKGTAKEWKATPENVATLKAHLVAMIASATGGPQKYTGRAMKEVHKGMQISDKEFAAMADDLKASLDKLKVPVKMQDELLSIVASTGKDIVEPALPMPKKLYERLGGDAAVTAVVDDFVTRALADPKANFTRKGTAREWKATPENVAVLKRQMVQIIGSVTGGPQKYTGSSMKEAHKGMKITAAEFDALAADLKASLEKAKVPAKEQGELLAIVAGTKKDIVEAAAPKAK
jgi:hemoglobin